MSGKKCLVTGASRGIGKAIVKRLLEAGSIVVASASSAKGLSALKSEFSEFGENLFVIRADLSLQTEVELLCESVTTVLGAIDVLINNAGLLCLESFRLSLCFFRASESPIARFLLCLLFYNRGRWRRCRCGRWSRRWRRWSLPDHLAGR